MAEQFEMKNVLKQKLVVKCKACGGTGTIQTGKRGKQPYCRACDRKGFYEYDLNDWDMSVVYEHVPISVDMVEVCERAIEDVKDIFKDDLERSTTDDEIVQEDNGEIDKNKRILVDLGLVAY